MKGQLLGTNMYYFRRRTKNYYCHPGMSLVLLKEKLSKELKLGFLECSVYCPKGGVLFFQKVFIVSIGQEGGETTELMAGCPQFLHCGI